VTRPQLRPWCVAAVIVGVVYSWIAAGARPFTTPENVLVAIPIAIGLIVGARRGSEPEQLTVTVPVGEERGTAVWVALLAVLVGWELAALFSSPREAHPTLSSVADTIMSVHVGRAAMFAVWLAAGAALALFRPRERR
jgi:hypothetical protein